RRIQSSAGNCAELFPDESGCCDHRLGTQCRAAWPQWSVGFASLGFVGSCRSIHTSGNSTEPALESRRRSSLLAESGRGIFVDRGLRSPGTLLSVDLGGAARNRQLFPV